MIGEVLSVVGGAQCHCHWLYWQNVGDWALPSMHKHSLQVKPFKQGPCHADCSVMHEQERKHLLASASSSHAKKY